MTYQNILVRIEGAVGIVTLNRPQALNALSAALISELASALDDFENDATIGAIVLTGSEKAFAAGADIKEMVNKSYPESYLEDFITSGWERLGQCRKPVVAAVAGFALGGGCEIAMMCDIVICAENARFGQPPTGQIRADTLLHVTLFQVQQSPPQSFGLRFVWRGQKYSQHFRQGLSRVNPRQNHFGTSALGNPFSEWIIRV